MRFGYWDIDFLITEQGMRFVMTTNVIVLLALGFGVLLVAVGWPLLRRHQRYHRGEAGPICARCHYPAKHLESDTCPECGQTLSGAGVIPDGRLRGPSPRLLRWAWTLLMAGPLFVAWVAAGVLIGPRFTYPSVGPWMYVYPWPFHLIMFGAAGATWYAGIRWIGQRTKYFHQGAVTETTS